MELIVRTVILFCCVTLAACSQEDSSNVTNNIANQNVDLILTNGKVLTVDDQFSIQDTVVVNDGKIVATGGASLTSQYASDNVVDLQGKVLMPGFNDSHTHIRGRPQRYIELSNVTSIIEIQDLIRSILEVEA